MTAPTVQTVEPEAITNTEAILRGYCWHPGSDSIMYITFLYGKTTGYGYQTQYFQVTHGTVPGYFVAKITGLDPNSTYHFQICGVEGSNWNYGGDKQFKTRATAPDGTPGHYWIEGDYFCYLDSSGYKRVVKGEG